MTATHADLVINILRPHPESYQVEQHFTNPRNEAETTPVQTAFPLNLKALLPLALDSANYGKTLSKQLFHEPKTLDFYREIKAATEATDLVLRIRLRIDSAALDLHALRWELLVDPVTGTPLATSERILFSRFMTSRDKRLVQLRPKSELRALVAVANPINLAEDYPKLKLAPVDLDGEIQRAHTSLKGIAVEVVGKEQPLTLTALVQALRQGVDILYLVCHGMLRSDSGPMLCLQNEDGTVSWESGNELALRISEMTQPPRLVVLASCQSAGTGQVSHDKNTVQAALAPCLADAGVAAIIAMQGNISMDTVETMMPVFFTELLKDGRIDRAMSTARGIVRERPDFWLPALFLRLRRGCIWYEPGFGKGEEDEVRWKAMVNAVCKKSFTPIIGWGLGEKIYGTSRNLARQLAKSHQFPLASHQRADLPVVAQYLRVNQNDSAFPLDEVKKQLCQEILRRHNNTLDPKLHDASLSKLLKEIGQQQLQNKENPYRILAQLPAKVFISACPDTLLSQALKEAGKEPDIRYAFWKRNMAPPEPYEREPTVQRPLVFHIFGHFKDSDSLVLTEDDYFDYLIGASRNRSLVPPVIRHALAGTSLMFLGFQLDDWSFRILFRLIMNLEGGARRKRLAHAAVQVDPDGGPLIDADEAREYLREYYGGEDISIFWGNGDDFLQQLQTKLPDLSSLEQEEDDDF